MKKVLKIHPKDNVLVALQDLKQGETVYFDNQAVTLINDIAAKHKFATETLLTDQLVRMYDVPVGKATRTIHKGEAITTQNIQHTTQSYSIDNQLFNWQKPDISKFEGRTFRGYHRSDGKVGTANYWLVIPLVFCENRNVEVLKEILIDKLGYGSKRNYEIDLDKLVQLNTQKADNQDIITADILIPQEKIKQNRVFQNIDGIKFLTHAGGCGGTRQDSEILCKLLAGYITHPNVAGATVLSLGCQNAQIPILKQYIEQFSPQFDKPLYVLEQQKSASEPEMIAEAVKLTFVGLRQANQIERKPAPFSALNLGLKCGGSDGFSGISANPALGYAADLLVALGGKALLAEFPELNGVEQELINRCENKVDAEKFARLMRTYAQKAEAVGSSFAYNPSPGNIKDGLITDAMKSAGAARKGGTSPIVGVLDYAEQTQKAGLHLLCTPGNDVEATTGLAGSGANIIVFTTGLGTPTGNPISPTLKFATNSPLFQKMKDILDIDAGTIITGEDTIQAKGEELLDLIIRVASGEYTPKAVLLGQDDFIPWKRDISL
ncbi:MAG: altronate dehydratase family protein [Microscillaceae bacterium]|jgi:altronate hydrolase|nr:altronate dehydratase family protein [Microscillaceae bacterium]